MTLGNTDIQALPTTLIVSILELLVAGSFKDFYNFFIAWSQTQRPATIFVLLHQFPIRVVYKFGNTSNCVELDYFNRFYGIATRLQIPDAMLYMPCRNLIRGIGNVDEHFLILDGLSQSGHFLAMVSNFMLRSICKRKDKVFTLSLLLDIYKHPDYKQEIALALRCLQAIQAGVNESQSIVQSNIQPSCPVHPELTTNSFHQKYPESEDCLFCNIAIMVSAFCSRKSES